MTTKRCSVTTASKIISAFRLADFVFISWLEGLGAKKAGRDILFQVSDLDNRKPRGEFTDLSQVEKFEITEDTYDKMEGLFFAAAV